MSGFENFLLAYLLNSLWQAPLLFAAAWIATCMLRGAGPAAEHPVWVGALVLEGVIPAVSILPWQSFYFAWPWHANGGAIGDAHVSVQMAAGTGFAALRLPPAVMTVLSVAYGLLTTYFIARFAWRCMRLSALMRGAEPLMLSGEAAVSCKRWLEQFDIARPIAIVCSDKVFAPVTLGMTRRRVVLPAGLVARLPNADLDTAIAHEFAHVRRNDFLKNLLYEIMALPMSYHPCLWYTRQRMMETREMVCDEMAAGISGRQNYAQSLLRLAALLLQGRPVSVPHAIGVFDANTLERRLMKLTEKKKRTGRLRVCMSVVVCAVLGVATAASAVALRLGVDSQATMDKQATKKPRSIPPKTMAENIISKVNPKYPPEAKKAGIQGTVVLDAVVGKTGDVEKLNVVSGPNELQQSSLDAVRQWKYRPFLLNGDPIEVETTISVIYSLQK
ncbi:MAG: M56 family metallopeptidase [Terracidiphilus sp.]